MIPVAALITIFMPLSSLLPVGISSRKMVAYHREGAPEAGAACSEISEGKALAEAKSRPSLPRRATAGKPEPRGDAPSNCQTPATHTTIQFSPDRDLARLGVPGLGQGQGQDAVFEVGADLLLVDLVRQRERARVVTDVVLGIDRLHVLVLR